MLRYLSPLIVMVLLAACSVTHPEIPAQYTRSDSLPPLYPDYTEVVLPCNIAAPNFLVDDRAITDVVAEVEYQGQRLTFGQRNKVIFDPQDWRNICQSAVGSDIRITLYTCRDKGAWQRHPSFGITIAADSIDPWVAYRLIEPSYVSYDRIDICRHSLTDGTEQIIVSNEESRKANSPQCINCHSFQASNPQNMLYHVRGKNGGTQLTYNGTTRFLTDLKRPGMISNPVYPAWHPTLPLIAFSTDLTGQLFHTHGQAKVEVQDTRSHLVLYDIEADRMTSLPADDLQLDCFPTWSPDGSTLYYTSASITNPDSIGQQYRDVRYDLWMRTFNADSLSFGQPTLVLDMASEGKSATLPRVSPDGRYLLYAVGDFGCFHIWHEDADIQLLNLVTMERDSLPAVNSLRAESYPTWSSNGRWIFLASRRDDSNYSRIYIAYFDAEGKAHKAFALPQIDPMHDRLLLRSYNRPEPLNACQNAGN